MSSENVKHDTAPTRHPVPEGGETYGNVGQVDGQSTHAHLESRPSSAHPSGFRVYPVSLTSGNDIWKGDPNPGLTSPMYLRNPFASFAPPPIRSMANPLVAPN